MRVYMRLERNKKLLRLVCLTLARIRIAKLGFRTRIWGPNEVIRSNPGGSVYQCENSSSVQGIEQQNRTYEKPSH